jgi:protein-S-isoprenylcysteine O-methyltransferase Ste14
LIDSINRLFNHPGLRSLAVKLRIPIIVAAGIAVIRYADPRWLWAGFIVSMLGEFIQLWSFASLNKNVDLAAQGPYAMVRNPMYLGRFFILLGVLALLGNVWLLAAYTVGYWFYMSTRVGREERRLKQVLGAPYEAYCAEVSRFVPGAPYRGNKVLFWDWKLFGQNNGHLNFIGTAVFWAAAIIWVLSRG